MGTPSGCVFAQRLTGIERRNDSESMSTRRHIGAAVFAVVLAGAMPSPVAGSEQASCLDPADADYATYECKVSRLRERSFVVVAVPDTGINPYHLDFRLPPDDDMVGVPPWEYISGYPRDAQALDLSLDAESYDEAVQNDRGTWEQAKDEELYYVPGTKIVGARAEVDREHFGPYPILDYYGHGAQVASVAAGGIYGSAPDPEVLVVALQRDDDGGTHAWAAAQPWIDVISISTASAANAYIPNEVTVIDQATRAAVDSGKVVTVAAGNGVSGPALACDRALTTTSRYAGPPWVISVGAVSPRSGQSYCWHSVSPDVSSYGLHWPAAASRSIEGEEEFGGTSNATPVTAGVMAAQILEARRMFGDTEEGPHGDGSLAVAGPGATIPGQGPLTDGVLNNMDVRVTTEKTAFPEEFTVEGLQEDLSPENCLNEPDVESCFALALLYSQNLIMPTTPAYYTYQGYGIVNKASRDRAIAVLRGQQPIPERPDVDAWMEQRRSIATLLWEEILPSPFSA